MLYKTEYQENMTSRLMNKVNQYDLPECVTSFTRRVRSSNSKVAYWNVLRQFLEWKFSDLNSITEDMIHGLTYLDGKDYMDMLISKEDVPSQSTINLHYNVLVSFGSHLVAIGFADKNFMDGVNKSDYKLSVNKNSAKLPTKQQIDELKENICRKGCYFYQTRDSLIVDILQYSGLREFEMLALNISDCHIGCDNPYLSVLRKHKYVASQVENIYIPHRLADEIADWISVLNDTFENVNDDFPLLVSKKGKRITATQIKQLFKNKSSGLTPHMLRHYYSTRLYQLTNGDLAFVQEQMGHSQGSNVTLDTYVAGSESSRMALDLL